jgi:hypothetical protein
MSDIKNKYLVNSLVGDYQKLTQDIMMYENELDTRDRKWQEIGGIKNPNFREDRRKNFISNKIENLTEQRNRIWSFLSLQFKNNTVIRDQNFKRLSKLNEDLGRVSKELKDKRAARQTSQGFLGKQMREYEILKYQNSKDRELIYLHTLGLITLIICLGLMVSVVLGRISQKNMIVGCGIILVLFLLYLVKVVYVDNVNKSIRYNNEVDFNKPDGLREDDGINADTQNNNNDGSCNIVEETRFGPTKQEDEVMKEIAEHANINDGECLAKV